MVKAHITHSHWPENPLPCRGPVRQGPHICAARPPAALAVEGHRERRRCHVAVVRSNVLSNQRFFTQRAGPDFVRDVFLGILRSPLERHHALVFRELERSALNLLFGVAGPAGLAAFAPPLGLEPAAGDALQVNGAFFLIGATTVRTYCAEPTCKRSSNDSVPVIISSIDSAGTFPRRRGGAASGAAKLLYTLAAGITLASSISTATAGELMVNNC
eukprot:CAMPEP_0117519340 /NCGR_PEP_ID=MMETSP0784-20121206/32599_1 /TAXON_ID=39447 /ORGANISM="" /LENGTH=215 /DNA_ID=CAMNT_0005315293 /DNA_START=106 /DNA_END=754 /DNA_ORIENTATION=-